MPPETANKKPPLGLTPKRHWEENRVRDIYDAIIRYRQAGRPVPFEWIEELYQREKPIER